MNDKIRLMTEIKDGDVLCGHAHYQFSNIRTNGKTRGGKVRYSYTLTATKAEAGLPVGYSFEQKCFSDREWKLL